MCVVNSHPLRQSDFWAVVGMI